MNTSLGIKRRIENNANLLQTILKSDKTKIFGIGRNKTGTTSLKAAMEEFGFVVGNQRTAELLFDDWAKQEYKRIIKYCKTAQFFQDVPFSLPNTFKVLDEKFPNSKFILTVRDSPEQWYNSITKFHAKIWGKNGRIPTKEDLQNAFYIYKGRPWFTSQLTFNTPEEDPYNKDILITHYNKQYFVTKRHNCLIMSKII